MHPDHVEYRRFTGKSELEKSVNSLAGLIEGITIDSEINESEMIFLQAWLDEHQEIEHRHPYNELIPVVRGAIADGKLTEDEKQDVLWLCSRLTASEFYDAATADMQRLHAILGGIAADGKVSEAELNGLSDWLADHEHLRTRWPYDEVDSLITDVLQDKKIDEKEHRMLLGYFSEFTSLLDDRTITSPPVAESDGTIVGVCAVCPTIEFDGSTFAFTGASFKYKRTDFADVVRAQGGVVLPGVSAKLTYLIVGAEGNPCWAYACYGRKVEQAVQLRRKGIRIVLVHENDFHDAVADSA